MSFASAFLNQPSDQTIEEQVGFQIEVLLLASSPECKVGPELPCVSSSNLCFGIPMDWALNEGQRNKRVKNTVRARILKFEPRFAATEEISITDNVEDNAVEFTITGNVHEHAHLSYVEISKTLSRMDQSEDEAV